MQKAKILSAVALAFAAGGVMAQDLAAASLPSAVWFDGYCDGITGITKLGTTYTGAYDAYTNCGLIPVVVAGGPSGFMLQGTKGAGASFTAETYPYYAATFIFNISTKGTWAITDAYGDAINSGTWTAGLTGPRGLKASISR